MPNYFRAVAIDFDGTLTEHGRLGLEVLGAIADTRRAGCKVLLVTGRILSELEMEFPDIGEQFDAVVGENGGVLSDAHGLHLLASPVDAALGAALRAGGVRYRRGKVLLACEARDQQEAMTQIARLGLDCQLVRNRGALMVVPSGVSKGSGVYHALGRLGVSYHSAVAVGDAENDHALLSACELGAAVADAVEALKERADIVLDEPDGAGVVELLRGPILAGEQRIHPRRWTVEVGTTDAGDTVRIPASQINALVVGGTGAGKSYVAGLLAEQLIDMGYSVLVIDPEGDHVGLRELRGVLVLGGTDALPTPRQLVKLFDHRFGSVVLDLSLIGEAETTAYLRGLPREVNAHRETTGLPHWIIVDEAHGPMGRNGAARALFQPGTTGYCLVTYQHEHLGPEITGCIDHVIGLAGTGAADSDDIAGVAEALLGIDRQAVESVVPTLGIRQAAVMATDAGATVRVCTLRERTTAHVRHWHKYARAKLPAERRFYFERGWSTPTGAVAANLEEFHRVLADCDTATVSHHLRHFDFSRWIAEVMGDMELADAVAGIERRFEGGAPPLDPEGARRAVLAAIEARYLG